MRRLMKKYWRLLASIALLVTALAATSLLAPAQAAAPPEDSHLRQEAIGFLDQLEEAGHVKVELKDSTFEAGLQVRGEYFRVQGAHGYICHSYRGLSYLSVWPRGWMPGARGKGCLFFTPVTVKWEGQQPIITQLGNPIAVP